jgi:predicted nucleic acid-binding protein
MSAVLADTGPLHALADPSDQFHSRAAKEMRLLEKRGVTVIVCYATLCEAYTLVLRRLGVEYARQWLAEILEGATLVNPDVRDYLLGAERLERFAGQPITLVDAVTAAIGGRMEIPIWTFDRHFSTMRAPVWRA